MSNMSIDQVNIKSPEQPESKFVLNLDKLDKKPALIKPSKIDSKIQTQGKMKILDDIKKDSSQKKNKLFTSEKDRMQILQQEYTDEKIRNNVKNAVNSNNSSNRKTHSSSVIKKDLSISTDKKQKENVRGSLIALSGGSKKTILIV